MRNRPSIHLQHARARKVLTTGNEHTASEQQNALLQVNVGDEFVSLGDTAVLRCRATHAATTSTTTHSEARASSLAEFVRLVEWFTSDGLVVRPEGATASSSNSGSGKGE